MDSKPGSLSAEEGEKEVISIELRPALTSASNMNVKEGEYRYIVRTW
jgi:hypothetical protein